MQGLMMQQELMISDLIEHAAKVHSNREIYTLNADMSEHRYTWADCAVRTRKLANALIAAGVKTGDRVATIAWNNYRHIEIYYAVSSIGAIVHTINPRLKPEQIAWMVNHAEDSFLMFDTTFGPIVDGVSAMCPTVKKWICLTDATGLPDYKTDVQDYENFIAEASDKIDWPRFDENTACTLCYTSGTTGDPKGVLYSHRSTILHAMGGSFKDVIGAGSRDVILAVVPMFHVSAWGLVYAAAMVGAKLVMPGPGLDGANMCKMITQESVSIMAGVPTVWLGIYNHAKANDIELPSVEKALVGGSALPESLLRAYELDLGIPMQQGWGMTETSPLGSTYAAHPDTDIEDYESTVSHKLLAGRRIFGVDMRIEEMSLRKTAKPRVTSTSKALGWPTDILKAPAPTLLPMMAGLPRAMLVNSIPQGLWKLRTVPKTSSNLAANGLALSMSKTPPQTTLMSPWPLVLVFVMKNGKNGLSSLYSQLRVKHLIKTKSKNASPRNVRNGGCLTKSFSKTHYHSEQRVKSLNVSSK